jgi:hypothetical protein
VLIWLGKRPSWTADFPYMSSLENLLKLHQETRRSLFSEILPARRSDPNAWEPVFDRYQITDVLIRLWETRLLRKPDPTAGRPRWSLAGLGPRGRTSRAWMSNRLVQRE